MGWLFFGISALLVATDMREAGLVKSMSPSWTSIPQRWHIDAHTATMCLNYCFTCRCLLVVVKVWCKWRTVQLNIFAKSELSRWRSDVFNGNFQSNLLLLSAFSFLFLLCMSDSFCVLISIGGKGNNNTNNPIYHQIWFQP